MVDAKLGATEAAKEALRLVRASVAVAVAFLMIDALRQEAVMQSIPAARFIEMFDRAGHHAGAVRDGAPWCGKTRKSGK